MKRIYYVSKNLFVLKYSYFKVLSDRLWAIENNTHQDMDH